MIKRVSVSSLPAGENIDAQISYAISIEKAGADIYHYDIMDGKFVTNMTDDGKNISSVKSHITIPIEAHLMCIDPYEIIDNINRAKIITIHIECGDMQYIRKCISKIKSGGRIAGVAIDIDTDISNVYELLDDIDILTIMSVKAGAGGQTFNPVAIEKLKSVRKINTDIIIQVDGGIDKNIAKQLYDNGADIVAIGSYIHNTIDKAAAIQAIKE